MSPARRTRVMRFVLSGYPHSEFRVWAQDLVQGSRFVELWELGEVDRAVSLGRHQA
jgi:hypothetical protein